MDNVFPEKNFLENMLLIVKKSPAAQLPPGRQNRQEFPAIYLFKYSLVAGFLFAILRKPLWAGLTVLTYH